MTVKIIDTTHAPTQMKRRWKGFHAVEISTSDSYFVKTVRPAIRDIRSRLKNAGRLVKQKEIDAAVQSVRE